MHSSTRTSNPQRLNEILEDIALEERFHRARAITRRAWLEKEIFQLTKNLRHEQKGLPADLNSAYESLQELWLNYNVTTPEGRDWESLVVRKACFLYGIRYREISREARVAYRTLQYFIHNSERVGLASCQRIVLATKLILARRILWFQEPYSVTWERWSALDARNVPLCMYRRVKRCVRAFLREKARKLPYRTLRDNQLRNYSGVPLRERQ